MRHTVAMELSVGLVLWVISFAALAVATGLGLILAYHWIRYAVNPFMTTVSIAAYIAVVSVLLSILFGVAVSYSI